MQIIKDIKYGEYDANLLDLYLPDGDAPCNIMVWTHGGGLAAGTKNVIRFVEDFVNRGIAVASVEYRMYPNAAFPDYIEDFAAAVKFLQNKEKFPRFIDFLISGRSAGAYMTLMLYFDKKFFKKAKVDMSRVKAFISDSAQTTVHFNVLVERGLDKRLERIDEAAPIFFLAPDVDTSIPLLIIYYENDMVCRPEQTRLFYRKLIQLAPDAENTRVFMKELPGTHVHGSGTPNEDGTFDYSIASFEFLEKIGFTK